MKNLNLKFVDVKNPYKVCLVNGKQFLDKELYPETDYLDIVNQIVENDMYSVEEISLRDVTNKVMFHVKDKEGLDIAWFAWTYGFVISSHVDKLREKFLHTLIFACGKKVHLLCNNLMKGLLEDGEEPEFASVAALVVYGVICHVITDLFIEDSLK